MQYEKASQTIGYKKSKNGQKRKRKEKRRKMVQKDSVSQVKCSHCHKVDCCYSWRWAGQIKKKSEKERVKW